MSSGHVLRTTSLLDKTVLCCSCGTWLETVAARLLEAQNDAMMTEKRREWLRHVREA